MSKQRQIARAERERVTRDRAAARRADAHRTAAVRTRRARRDLAWRRARLWQHGPSFHRNRERWGVLATVVLMILLLVYLVSRSVGDVLITALALVICSPVLVLLFLDRRSR